MHKSSSGEILACTIMLMIILKGVKAAAYNIRGTMRGLEKSRNASSAGCKYVNESMEVTLMVEYLYEKRYEKFHKPL